MVRVWEMEFGFWRSPKYLVRLLFTFVRYIITIVSHNGNVDTLSRPLCQFPFSLASAGQIFLVSLTHPVTSEPSLLAAFLLPVDSLTSV